MVTPFPPLPKTSFSLAANGAPLYDAHHMHGYALRYSEECAVNASPDSIALKQVQAERDDADRRAGAAERAKEGMNLKANAIAVKSIEDDLIRRI